MLEKQGDYEGSGPDEVYEDFDDTPILNKFLKIIRDEMSDPPTIDAALTLSWTEFKKKAEESYVVVATGEPAPRGSIILEAGVLTMGAGGGDYTGQPRPLRFG